MLKHVKIGHKLLGGFGLVMAIFIALAVYQLGVIERLGQLQDAGANRALDTKKIMDAMLRVSDLYALVADGEINRNLARTKEDFANSKKLATEDVHTVVSLVDTPEERTHANSFSENYRAYLVFFEKDMLPLIEKIVLADKNDPTIPEMENKLREMDGQIDTLREASLKPLNAIVSSFATENKAGDQLFDDERASASRILMLITGAAALLALAISLTTARSVTRPLDKSTAFANHLAQGDLEHVLDI